MLTEAPTRIHRYHELTVSVLSLLHGWIWKFLHSAWFPHCHWRIEFWVAHGHVSLQTVFLKRTRPEAFSNHEEHKPWVISVGKSIVHSWSLGYSSAGLGQGCVSKSARVRVNNIEKKKKRYKAARSCTSQKITLYDVFFRSWTEIKQISFFSTSWFRQFTSSFRSSNSSAASTLDSTA